MSLICGIILVWLTPRKLIAMKSLENTDSVHMHSSSLVRPSESPYNQNRRSHHQPHTYGTIPQQDSESEYEDENEETEISLTTKICNLSRKFGNHMKKFRIQFWILLFIHSVYLIIFYSVNNFLPLYLHHKFQVTALQAGYLSSLTTSVVCLLFL